MSSPTDDAPPLDLTRPFTRAAARASGMPDSTLRGPLFRKVLHGVYISAAIPEHPRDRVAAALLFHGPDAYASHTSAARAYEVPIPERLTDEHVSVPAKGKRRHRNGVTAHLARVKPSVWIRGGLRISSPAQTFLEMAALCNLVELVVIGDALVASTSLTPDELMVAAQTSKGRHARLARRAARYVRAGVDSRMETLLRMLLVLAGLPEPMVNHKVFDDHGNLKFRYDLYYEELRLIVEYDGRQHRDDLAQWDRDNARDDYFDDNDLRIVRVFSWGIFKKPEDTLTRIQNAIRSQGGRVPARLREDWRPFFPGRD